MAETNEQNTENEEVAEELKETAEFKGFKEVLTSLEATVKAQNDMIEELKKTNMKLALTNSSTEKPKVATEILYDMFENRKRGNNGY